ncbi:DUF397 domain-containing protein [Streptomyces sp. Ru87]|uniref:DUF397 domain-containing protein n=1 Tax=Streptomyces sp. Ru87 TaxID=2044307 RepID=UPI000BF27417|nr:DUF397 domain-containing protein [Streptomyces sp. Ru87]PGH50293.1 DUF397 domain-containing protein [Streptomyces sp. Ru87]
MIREGAAEIESALTWRKSSYSSNSSEADCVEVATAPGTVHVRDSKNAEGPRLAVTSVAWAHFVAYASER